jgi:hypothetical protein
MAKKRSKSFDDVQLEKGFREWQETGAAPTWLSGESRPWRERKTVDDIETIAEGAIEEEEKEESQTRMARLKKRKK